MNEKDKGKKPVTPAPVTKKEIKKDPVKATDKPTKR
jgi:hypothetical protein